MAHASASRARHPLAEASDRINSPLPPLEHHAAKSRRHHGPGTSPNHIATTDIHAGTNSAAASVENVARNARVSAVLRPPSVLDEDKRLSQASYASTSSSRSKKNYKTHIGPWQLGKTLGKGSSARVRLCRHAITNQHAAVKIVNRRMAYLVQDSSLAALTKWDNSLPEHVNGEMRVPMAIEREVAILKLIEHPNIMKLYDIWENRSEIYLILEYIEQGDLFTFINSRGRLTEEMAVYFFRQMISAITYCHAFNICHRDLKPENILITADLQIKIADFGMAALHQTATHQLATACGSPHYAAPELLKNRQYHGDRADIWSLGVILYAMLSATLPFDDPDLRVMMAKTKKGHYEMPQFLSPEAEDLIRRMLQVNPDRRITLKDIWRHRLIQKYAYLDDFGDRNGQLPDTRKGFQYNPVPRHEIDPQLLRQLRSMWHMFSEHDLALKLTCEEPNDQKAFYWLLYNYREKQLEDFKPELAHSMSDYHHLKPGAWKRRISTCQFSQPRANGHGRSVSRFTVISNATETEPDTIQSYDPYRGSRMLQPCSSQASHAKVTVHRDSLANIANTPSQATRPHTGANPRRARASSMRASISGRPQSSRGSVSSVQSARHGASHARGPSLRHKRGVDFSHVRKRSTSATPLPGPPSTASQAQAFVDEAETQAPTQRPTSPEPPRNADGTHPKANDAPATILSKSSMLFNEELRHFSNNIARDCDEAFRSSLMEDDTFGGSFATDGDVKKSREQSPFLFGSETGAETSMDAGALAKQWGSRPLPPLPSESFLSSPPLAASTPPTSVRPSTRGSDQDDCEFCDEPVGKLALPVLLPKQVDRRTVSAPAYGQHNKQVTTLPSINEDAVASGQQNDKARIVSAPPRTPNNKRPNDGNSSMEYLSKVENTIRVVHSPSAVGPVKAPEPLKVRKKAGAEAAPSHVRRVTKHSRAGHERVPNASDFTDGTKKRKISWFKRPIRPESATGETMANLETRNVSGASTRSKQSGSASTEGGKKKGFNFTFWKNGSKERDGKMTITDGPEDDVDDRRTARRSRGGSVAQSAWRDAGTNGARHIEVKQNWLARLFRVKPATGYLCMTISRKQARQEIAILLREWRKYGIRGVQVDRQRNIVFARVGPRNYLDLKEVAFAAEVMTVIEHGKRQQLSIVRITQERGAASSFHRVVDTMRMVLDSRNLIVADKSKRKMMIKTLNASASES